VSVKLPANVEGVFEAMKREVKRPHTGTIQRLREQSGRTAWKLMQDWVEVQLSLIAMQQAEFIQVFLPYVWVGKQTFFDRIKNDNYLALGPGKEK
jgi:hypothetical protein